MKTKNVFIFAARAIACPVVLFFMCFFCAGNASAKRVNLEWQPIKYAVKYELQITQNGKSYLDTTLDHHAWSGELKTGHYQYQIRAIDKLDRRGQMSQARSLVVMPSGAELQSPSDGTSLTLYDPRTKVTFSWKEIAGITSYEFTLLKDKKTVAEFTTTGTQANVSSLATGDYSWTVKAVIEGGHAQKSWKSKDNQTAELRITQKQLEKPIPKYPLGQIVVTPNKKYKFKWSKVEGATGYVLHVYPLTGRVPAADKTIKLTTADTEIDVPAEGKFKWEVNAVADVDSKAMVMATGASSVAQFNIIQPNSFRENKATVALAGLYGPMSFQESSPVYNVKANTPAQTSGFKMNAEYFFTKALGLGFSVQNQQIQAGQAQNSANTFELTGIYRTHWGSPSTGYVLSTPFGLGSRDYVMFLPGAPQTGQTVSTQINPYSITVIGPKFGVDLKKQLSNHFGVGAQLNYFFPLALAHSSGGSAIQGLKSNSANLENLNFGLLGSYFLSQHLSVNLGAFMDFKSLAFGRDSLGTSAGTGPETINMNSEYLLLSFGYTFGN